MESNSRAPVLKMNGKEKELVCRISELSSGSWNSAECQMTILLLVVCSMMLARRLQMCGHQCWSSKIELEITVLSSGVENEQFLQCLMGRAYWDSLVQCHGQLWRLEDRACTWLAQACAANEVNRTADQIRVSANQNGRKVTLLHSSPAGIDSEHAVNC